MWLHTFSRPVLPLVTLSGLIRPFAQKLPPGYCVKYLHDDTKQPGAEPFKRGLKFSPALEALVGKPQDKYVDIQTASEKPGLKKDQTQEPTVAAQKPKALSKRRCDRTKASDAEITSEKLVLEEDQIEEHTVAARKPKGKRAQSPALGKLTRKAQDTYLNVQNHDASENPGLEKDQIEKRTVATREPKILSERKPNQVQIMKAYHEKARSEGYRNLAEYNHAVVVRDIEAANRRKLAEDPTYEPLPLPDMASRPPPVKRRKASVRCHDPACHSKRFLNETTLRVHLRRCHGARLEETPYKCKHPDCDEHFETKEGASKHFSRSHGPRPICPICERSYVDNNSLRHHLVHIHGMERNGAKDHIPFKRSGPICPVCETSLVDKDTLDTHLAEKHGMEGILVRSFIRDKTAHKCSICDKALSDKSTFQRHLANIHGMDEEEIKHYTRRQGPGPKCAVCENSFADQESLTSHLVNVHGMERSLAGLYTREETRLKCPVCPKTFRFKKTLRVHMTNVHGMEKKQVMHLTGRQGSGPMTCSECKSRFSSKRALKYHLVARHGMVC